MPRGKRAIVDIDFQLDGPNIECFVHHEISRLDQVRAAAMNVYVYAIWWWFGKFPTSQRYSTSNSCLNKVAFDFDKQ